MNTLALPQTPVATSAIYQTVSQKSLVGQQKINALHQNNINSLSTTLNEWSNRSVTIGNKMMRQEAENEAIQAVQRGDFEFETGDGLYSDVYNNSVSLHASSKAELELQAKANELKILNSTSPENYKKLYKEFANGVVRGMPDPKTKMLISNKAKYYENQGYFALEANKQKAVKALHTKTVKASLDQDVRNLAEATLKGAHGRVNDLNLAIQKKLEGMGYSPEMIDLEMGNIFAKVEEAGKKQTREQILEAFIVSPNKTQVMSDFMEDTESQFDFVERQKISDLMLKEINRSVTMNKRLEAQEEREEQLSDEAVQTELRRHLVNGSLSPQILNDAYLSGNIDSRTYDDLSVRTQTEGVGESDAKVYMDTYRNLGRLKNSDIYDNTLLSNEDKIKLVREKEDLGKWWNTADGKQARKEFDNSFGIYGTIDTMTDKYDRQIVKDYNMLDQKIFDEVKEFAPEEQGAMALKISRGYIDQYWKGLIEDTKPFIDRQAIELEQSKISENKKKDEKDTDNDNLWKFFYQKIMRGTE